MCLQIIIFWDDLSLFGDKRKLFGVTTSWPPLLLSMSQMIHNATYIRLTPKLISLPLLLLAYLTSPVPGQLHCQSQTCSNMVLDTWWLLMEKSWHLMTTGPAAWLTTPEEPWPVSPVSIPSLSLPLSSPAPNLLWSWMGGQCGMHIDD